MPGEDITVHVTVYLNRGDRPGGWSLIRIAWIDESGNPVVDIAGSMLCPFYAWWREHVYEIDSRRITNN
jgi:hypothetical protein